MSDESESSAASSVQRRPWLGAVASFAFPGLGQAYLGRHRLALLLGLPWPEAGEQVNGVVEGVNTVTGALELAAALGVEMPIAEQVRAVVIDRKPPMEAVAELMGRAQQDELVRG